MKLPQAWLTASKNSDPVTSRVDMSAEVAGKGNCPECKKPMQTATSNGSKVWVCVADRVALPIPDAQD